VGDKPSLGALTSRAPRAQVGILGLILGIQSAITHWSETTYTTQHHQRFTSVRWLAINGFPLGSHRVPHQ
jgi:hypothetical protein